jgi:hypothetical protein
MTAPTAEAMPAIQRSIFLAASAPPRASVSAPTWSSLNGSRTVGDQDQLQRRDPLERRQHDVAGARLEDEMAR